MNPEEAWTPKLNSRSQRKQGSVITGQEQDARNRGGASPRDQETPCLRLWGRAAGVEGSWDSPIQTVQTHPLLQNGGGETAQKVMALPLSEGILFPQPHLSPEDPPGIVS